MFERIPFKFFSEQKKKGVKSVEVRRSEIKTPLADLPETKVQEPIEQLYEPMKKILGELRDEIDGGKYYLLLGDDASGRIPTLIFRKVLSRLYQEKGFSPPKTLFFAARYESEFGEELERVKNDFQKMIEKTCDSEEAAGKKILIITDTISSGAHLLPFAQCLKDLDRNFDIAAIGRIESWADPAGGRVRLEEKLGGKIISGMSHVPSIYKQELLSGVKKTYKERSLFAEPSAKFSDNGKYAMRQIRQARSNAEVIAQRLIRWYQGD